ncbi:MAG: NADH-quinone oxidoreductase subunit NuoF [Coprothermobacter sp.]|nr:NADH-quinone oxidoreductase subunit NuoF [Coprothermobacter sp.]
MIRNQLLVCAGGACITSGEKSVKDVLVDELKKNSIEDEVQVIETGCMGACDLGPIVVVYPDGTFYQKVTVKNAGLIVSEHLVKGRTVGELLYTEPTSEKKARTSGDIPFYTRQVKRVLRNCGAIDPLSIEEYIARDGYFALGKALEMTPDGIIQVVLDSGLRGRGGAGFPTGLKWKAAREANGSPKYVVCNGDEGDPGAFMDRSVLEGDPHSIIEAMAIAGYAIGAEKGYMYVRAEYPLAIERFEYAIDKAREYGFLGQSILGTEFNFDIEIRIGAGAFVCGEETALLRSIEGKRGTPSVKPPFPAQAGLWNKPTLINNVETYANIPQILTNGAEWFRSVGSTKSPGTKVFALAGNVQNTGLVEVPMGTTLRELVFEIGGGIPSGKKFKAAQTGGPSGGVITAEYLDMPIDFDTVKEIGTIMGSGGLIVLDEDSCMVDVAKFYLGFTVDESCGKCTPCREGTRQMYHMMERICDGNGRDGDIEKLSKLADVIKDTSLCGLGQSAPNPVLSTIRFYEDEYRAHIYEKKCPSHVCKHLLTYSITPDKCVGCTACAWQCPVHAIAGEVKKIHVIDQSKCSKCGSCYESCRFGAIRKE